MKIEISAEELACIIGEFATLCSNVTLDCTLDVDEVEENEEDNEE